MRFWFLNPLVFWLINLVEASTTRTIFPIYLVNREIAVNYKHRQTSKWSDVNNNDDNNEDKDNRNEVDELDGYKVTRKTTPNKLFKTSISYRARASHLILSVSNIYRR